MTFRPLLAAAAALLAALSPALAAYPVVSNLTAAQRPGTKLVDITYDVTADTQTVKVILEISGDGEATWAVPVKSVTGPVGSDVAVGPDKTITWSTGVDWDRPYSPKRRNLGLADHLPRNSR